MENKSHAFAAGLFILVLGIAAVLAVYWFGGKREVTRELTIVTLDNVNGLNPQAGVRYRGIRVGKVMGIRLDAEDIRNILIDVQIDAAVPITRGTTAKLAYQGVTGLAHILLEEEGSDATMLTEGANGEPPRIQMSPSLLDELGDNVPDMMREAREVLSSVKALLNEHNRERISSILANAEKGSAELAPTLRALNDTLARAQAMMSDSNMQHLGAAVAAAGPLMNETRALMVQLQASAGKLDAALGEGNGNGLVALTPKVNELAQEAGQVTRQLNKVLRLLESSPQSLIFGPPASVPGPGEAGFNPGRNTQEAP